MSVAVIKILPRMSRKIQKYFQKTLKKDHKILFFRIEWSFKSVLSALSRAEEGIFILYHHHSVFQEVITFLIHLHLNTETCLCRLSV